MVDYFNAHRFGITVSMDGPKALHDRNRKTVGGKGTYDVVRRKVAHAAGALRRRAQSARA